MGIVKPLHPTDDVGSHSASTNLALAHGEGIGLVATLAGDSMLGTIQHSDMPGVAHAGLFSTAPYRGDIKPKTPPPRTDKRARRCSANNDTCMGWAGSNGLCGGHTVQAAAKKPID